MKNHCAGHGEVSKLASTHPHSLSLPYGPLLARSGYPGQDAFFYNNPMVMICATVNALLQLKTILCEFGQICATKNALMQLKTILCEF